MLVVSSVFCSTVPESTAHEEVPPAHNEEVDDDKFDVKRIEQSMESLGICNGQCLLDANCTTVSTVCPVQEMTPTLPPHSPCPPHLTHLTHPLTWEA